MSDDPRVNFKLAQAAFASHEWDTAVPHFETALSGYQSRGQLLNVAACHNNLGIIAYTQGNFAHAESHYRQSLTIYQQRQQRQDEASVLGNLGAVLQTWGRLEEATACYREALNIARQVGDRRVEASALGNLGAARFEAGDLDEAESLLQEALALAREVGNGRTEANVLGNLGVLYKDRSQYDLARRHLEDALALMQAEGHTLAQFSQLTNLGNICRHLGDYDAAMTWQQQALDVARQTGYRQGEVIAAGNLGLIAHARTDYDSALRHFQEALTQARTIDYRQGEAAQLENIAGCCIMLLRLDEAEAALRQAIPIEQETGNQYGYMLALADLSYVKLLQGDPQMALKHLQEAWPIARAAGGPEILARLCWSEADVHAELGEMNAAYKLYRQAIEHMEAIRGRLQRESDRASFITVERARIFGKLVLFLQQIYGHSAKAITYAERARSRLFLDQLSSDKFDSTLATLRSEPLSHEQIRDLIKLQK